MIKRTLYLHTSAYLVDIKQGLRGIPLGRKNIFQTTWEINMRCVVSKNMKEDVGNQHFYEKMPSVIPSFPERSLELLKLQKSLRF